MKLIVSKTAIEMAVKNICRVINPKNALPILGDVLCEENQAEKEQREQSQTACRLSFAES